MIQTLPPDRADEARRERILPGASGSREDFLDLHALHTSTEGALVDRITITEEIGGGAVIREGVHDLLSSPSRSGMLGDVEVQDPTPMVGKDHQDKEHTQASGGNGEEVDRNNARDVVARNVRQV
jgi:hypothetical protein